jgi:hypothetical protein
MICFVVADCAWSLEAYLSFFLTHSVSHSTHESLCASGQEHTRAASTRCDEGANVWADLRRWTLYKINVCIDSLNLLVLLTQLDLGSIMRIRTF